MRDSSLTRMSRAHEESRISVSLLHRLAGVLSTRDPAVLVQCLNAAGLTPAALSKLQSQTATLPESDLVQLDQLAAAQRCARRHYPDTTLRLYQAADLLDMGLMGYAMASSGTVRRAFEIAIEYHDVTSGRYELELIKTSDRVIVRQHPFIAHLADHVDLGEELAGVVRILQSTIGDQADCRRIGAFFSYPAPDHEDAYRVVFPGVCTFDAEHTEIHFPLKWLELPVTTANQSISEVCASMCERILSSNPLSGSTQDAVKRLLVSRVGLGMCSLETAAEALRLSVSQLRKRLYQEETSYKQIVLEVRMTLAHHYLRATNLSIQEVAYLLDYSQPAPFSRAFKSYFGHPPVSVRQL